MRAGVTNSWRGMDANRDARQLPDDLRQCTILRAHCAGRCARPTRGVQSLSDCMPRDPNGPAASPPGGYAGAGPSLESSIYPGGRITGPNHPRPPRRLRARVNTATSARACLIGGHCAFVAFQHVDLAATDVRPASSLRPRPYPVELQRVSGDTARPAPSARVTASQPSRARSDLPEAVGPTTAQTRFDAHVVRRFMPTSTWVPPRYPSTARPSTMSTTDTPWSPRPGSLKPPRLGHPLCVSTDRSRRFLPGPHCAHRGTRRASARRVADYPRFFSTPPTPM